AKELRDATDCYWVVAHVTPPSWKQHLVEISIEQLYDIHDRAYMRQAVLDNLDKDRAYAELERKCNEALQDLDKNPLVSDMRDEIKVLQGQVDGLHSEYSRLILEEKKWVNYEQTLSSLWVKIEGIDSERERLKSSEIRLLLEIDSLKQDRAVVVSKVTPDATMKLVRSDDLDKISGNRPSSKEEYDQAGDALVNASYPFLVEYVVDSYASLEQLLSKKTPSL
ncbi:hypothetical protein Tco_1083651, partial [Tanacetum coccineum]